MILEKKFKLLVIGNKDRFIHLEKFLSELNKKGIETKLIYDLDYVNKFFEPNFIKKFSKKKKFEEVLKTFNPTVILLDRISRIAEDIIEKKIPLWILMRGNYWEEVIWAKETIYKTRKQRLSVKRNEKLADYCFKNSELILPICNHLSEITKNRYFEKPVETMYQGINPDNWFHKKGMELKHPCIGILQSATIWEKTKELLILPKVLEKMPDVHFYWAGDGVYRDEVLPLLEKYDNFHWLGSLKYPDKVREFLTEIDVYALISGIDMSPLTLQEAQLMEKPVIATNVGGIPELMKDGKTGFLIEKDNPTELFDKLSLLLNNRENAQEMGKKGKEFVKNNFNWDKICNDFLNHLKKHSIGDN